MEVKLGLRLELTLRIRVRSELVWVWDGVSDGVGVKIKFGVNVVRSKAGLFPSILPVMALVGTQPQISSHTSSFGVTAACSLWQQNLLRQVCWP